MSKKKNDKQKNDTAEELETQDETVSESPEAEETVCSEDNEIDTNVEVEVKDETTKTELETELEAETEAEAEEKKEAKLSESDILKKELTELKNRYHRALADYQNLQRRSAKEVLESRLIGVGEFTKRLLPVIDTFEKAMEQINKADINAKVKDGLELFAVQFSDFLENEGLKEIPTKDIKFDPNLHEAMCKRTDENKEDEIILTEFNKGYTFKDRVLRPAQVEINNR